MTYPTSSDVSAGQPTLAEHYNHLRSDALRLGQSPADAATLGELLARYQSGVNLQILSTDRLRCAASSSAPVCLVIDGIPLCATANVDLSASAKPGGAASAWYVFAVRSAGSTTFSLEVNTSAAESANRRLIGSFYWDGSLIVSDSIRINEYDYYRNLLSFEISQMCCGRLTLTSGTAVTTTDVSGGTLYFTPYKGSRVALYAPGWGWRLYPFSELSASLSALSSGKNADVFIYVSGGVLALELVEWSTGSARATALALQDGVHCKSGSLERRYLGTLRTSSSGTASDSDVQRFVWNAYQRLPRRLKRLEGTNSWTYTTNAWRSWNNDSANQVEVVVGLSEEPLYLQALLSHYSDPAQYAYCGIGLDATDANSADVSAGGGGIAGRFTLQSLFNQYLSPGYHALNLIEYGDTGCTFYGDNGTGDMLRSGAAGWLLA
jgi:hypothetical protein